MKVLIHNQTQMYELVEDEAGALYLEIALGGVGVYMMSIRLDAEERAAYQAEGDMAIERLAEDVLRDPRRYEGRR